MIINKSKPNTILSLVTVFFMALFLTLTSGCGKESSEGKRALEKEMERTEKILESKEKRIRQMEETNRQLQEKLLEENNNFYVHLSSVLGVMVIAAFFVGIILGSGARKHAKKRKLNSKEQA